jgi:hypothetical protein
MTRKSQTKATQKTLKSKQVTDTLQKKMLDRFISLERVVSPYWSVRCCYRAAK